MKPGRITLGAASLELSMSAIVPVADRGRVLEVTNLLTSTNERRQNHATSLMQEVCEQADLHDMFLLLMPQDERRTTKESGMTTEHLKLWYIRKFGFQLLQESPVILIRLPRTAAQRWAANAID